MKSWYTYFLNIKDFASAEELQNFMEIKVGVCDGGFDAAEDVIGGLDQILKLTWTAKTRLVVFIADAPGHGIEFHDMVRINTSDFLGTSA
jgi:hypothetical protein